jgi:hypothetical protein
MDEAELGWYPCYPCNPWLKLNSVSYFDVFSRLSFGLQVSDNKQNTTKCDGHSLTGIGLKSGQPTQGIVQSTVNPILRHFFGPTRAV